MRPAFVDGEFQKLGPNEEVRLYKCPTCRAGFWKIVERKPTSDGVITAEAPHEIPCETEGCVTLTYVVKAPVVTPRYVFGNPDEEDGWKLR